MLKFALTLSQKGQAESARQEVVDYLAAFDIECTGVGLVTLSFAGREADFAAAFQSTPPPLSRNEQTVGASGPKQSTDVPVPPKLSELVDHISISPPISHFHKTPT